MALKCAGGQERKPAAVAQVYIVCSAQRVPVQREEKGNMRPIMKENMRPIAHSGCQHQPASVQGSAPTTEEDV
jgi:hypothetical protein